MGACTHKGLWLVDKTFAEQMDHEIDRRSMSDRFRSHCDRFHSHTLLSQLSMYSVTSFGWFCLFCFKNLSILASDVLFISRLFYKLFDTLRF